MAVGSAVDAGDLNCSYGSHVLDHLAAHGTGFAGGEVAVVAALQVDADFPWCTRALLKKPKIHYLFYPNVIHPARNPAVGRVFLHLWSCCYGKHTSIFFFLRE